MLCESSGLINRWPGVCDEILSPGRRLLFRFCCCNRGAVLDPFALSGCCGGGGCLRAGCGLKGPATVGPLQSFEQPITSSVDDFIGRGNYPARHPARDRAQMNAISGSDSASWEKTSNVKGLLDGGFAHLVPPCRCHLATEGAHRIWRNIAA